MVGLVVCRKKTNVEQRYLPVAANNSVVEMEWNKD